MFSCITAAFLVPGQWHHEYLWVQYCSNKATVFAFLCECIAYNVQVGDFAFMDIRSV